MLARIAVSAAVVLIPAGTGWSQWSATEEAKLTAADAQAGDYFGNSIALSGDTVVVGAPRDAYEWPVDEVEGLAFDPATGLLFGSDTLASSGPPALLVTFDPVNGVTTPIGDLKFTQVAGLAFDPATNTLYGTDRNTDQLIKINLTTGAGTKVGTQGLGFNRVNGLAFDPATGTLYGSDINTDQLIRISVTTGVGTAVGPIGFGDVQGLAFDPASNTLLGSDADARTLIRIDPTTGAGTAIGGFGFEFRDVRGLELDPGSGILYGVDTQTGQLLTIDLSTGGPGTHLMGIPGQYMGSAYVFVRNGTTWSEQAKLTASDAAMYDAFGTSVAVWGDTALVGAENDEHVEGSGSAYVYVRNGSTWVEQQKLIPSDADKWDRFGCSVSLSGDTALIGDWLESKAAYVFVRNGSTWTEQQKLLPSDSAVAFGRAVAVSGDMALIAAPGTGVYAFVRSGTTWTEQQKLTTSDPEAALAFGTAVAFEGDTAVIGAAVSSNFVAGSALVFVRSGSTWVEQQKLVGGGTLPDDFGRSVAVLPGLILVGGAGSLHFFGPTGSAWYEQAEIHSGAGSSVALSGDTAVAGAPQDNHAGTSAGAAWVYRTSYVPMTYCTAGTSASGCQALLSATGTPSAVAASGFTLSAATVEGAKDGLYFFGTNGKHATPFGNSSSYRCVVPPVKRCGLLTGNGTVGACDGVLSQDLNALWCPACPKPGHNPGAGALVQAQLWYRDPLNTSNQTTSFSDGIEFLVSP